LQATWNSASKLQVSIAAPSAFRVCITDSYDILQATAAKFAASTTSSFAVKKHVRFRSRHSQAQEVDLLIFDCGSQAAMSPKTSAAQAARIREMFANAKK